MNKEDFVTVEVDTKALESELRQFDEQMPNIARKLMRAVNAEAKKEIKREARNRGYKSHVEKAFGDAGYTKNLKSFADKGYKAKIMFAQNAFHYRFIESGAYVRPLHKKYLIFQYKGQWFKVKSFVLPAKPLLCPIAAKYWETNKGSEIMEKVFQKEMDKYFSKE